MRHWDAVVVGAGPAGSLTARGLALDGLRVLLVERDRWPRWKVCGGCLGPETRRLLELEGLGTLLGQAPPANLGLVTLHGAGRQVDLPSEGWAARSRTSLDAALVEEARHAGARFRAETTARVGPRRGHARVLTLRSREREEVVEASVVVDASGLGGEPETAPSAIRAPRRGPRGRHGGGRSVAGPHARVGLGAVFAPEASDMEPGRLHMVIRPAGYLGLVRLEDETVNAAAAVDPGLLRGRPPAEAVRALLGDAGLELSGSPLHGWRGTPPLGRVRPSAAAAGLFRVGDALAFVEPFTGEGIGWALEGARTLRPLAAMAAEAWDDRLAAVWEADHRGRAARGRARCGLLSRAIRRPALVTFGMRALSLSPRLARPWVPGLAAS